jgi:adenylate cyclase
LLLVTAAALLVLTRRSRLALAIALLAAAGILVAATLLLRGGLFLPIAASILTLALAWAARALYESRARYGRRAQLRATFESRVSPGLLRDILRGKVQVDEKPEGRPLACLAASFAGARDPPPPTQLPLAELEKLHGIFAAAVHRQGGMVESFAAGSALAVFGAPAALDDSWRHAAAAAREILQAVGRLDDERGNRGKAPVRWAMAASFGTGVAGKVAARGPLAHAVTGPVIEEALLLRLEAERLGKRFVASSAFEACAGCGLSDFQHPACD